MAVGSSTGLIASPKRCIGLAAADDALGVETAFSTRAPAPDSLLQPEAAASANAAIPKIFRMRSSIAAERLLARGGPGHVETDAEPAADVLVGSAARDVQ